MRGFTPFKMADELRVAMLETDYSCEQSDPPPNGNTGQINTDTCDRYDIWQDLCEVREARVKLSDSRKRRSPPSRSDSASCEDASVDYESLLSIEVEVKRRKVSEQDEAAALSYLLAPNTAFPIRRQTALCPDSARGVPARDNALDLLAAMNLITIDSNGDIKSMSDSARAFAEHLGCTQSTVVKATGLSTDPDAEELANFPSVMEVEKKKLSAEVLELLNAPTTLEQKVLEKFRTAGGSRVRVFCINGTKEECRREHQSDKACPKLHFHRIVQRHTDESLGDCSFLNACFNRATCKYVHYEVDESLDDPQEQSALVPKSNPHFQFKLFPAQWVNCDLRFLDMSVLGKFAVVMADPPWDIHMELPYGTMSDDEMRAFSIPALQDEGYIFIWVTGRAMELGRECLTLWGYERVDELVWVKTNQLQRLIRTGRTGHWINHSKEHCLVGVKGNPRVNKGVDCDVIVAEVRATSHKPDEIYGIIERLSPGTRKIELFGRMHNVQPNWVTLGNQLDGTRILEEDVKERFYQKYPSGVVMQQPMM